MARVPCKHVLVVFIFLCFISATPIVCSLSNARETKESLGDQVVTATESGCCCYANAVLQCLTCTKPLSIYLLHGSHSRTCCGKDWCLMCELEQHVMLFRDAGGPLSPSRILSHIRSINGQMGDGNQEDAHEFLRSTEFTSQYPPAPFTFLICVKCLRCSHESERYENIMDLTLEIYGWVESLEDALTQFTTPEDLVEENMNRCGRCASYARARKQLHIHEDPNILTIVRNLGNMMEMKKVIETQRFVLKSRKIQYKLSRTTYLHLKIISEVNYTVGYGLGCYNLAIIGGKIWENNKCITFPNMLDMVPFMTGMSDIPLLYMLYAVVMHLDTLNVSFSGHYVSYMKDLRGSWFRIDDTEVHPFLLTKTGKENKRTREFYEVRQCAYVLGA
ncbi:Ubiquitin carboxyl-terminal hydrolase 15 [Hibiscus syriacus]|uniref:Ubiquitin carboxyl-terminal hydrolase 15 n=1 Tax=Hibiscus syriacus TaxID=106335 RepID=A0A6A3AJC8_HIBSY|nr:Ubiquitin carboxyl-terminal hydrolase 15 [Hibiscus syriacus]